MNKIILIFIMMFYYLRINNVKSTEFTDLPNSINLKIFNYLEHDDLFNLAHICKKLYCIAREVVKDRKFRLNYLQFSPRNLQAGISSTSLFTQIIIRGHILSHSQIKILTSNSNLSNIVVRHAHMKSNKFKKFIKGVRSNHNLKVLDLQDMGIKAKNARTLNSCIKKIIL